MIVRRIRAHVSFATADRGHIHHRLMAHGYNQRQAVLLMYVVDCLLCVGLLIMMRRSIRCPVLYFCHAVYHARFCKVPGHLLSLFCFTILDPKTGEDEPITPKDPGFDEETSSSTKKKHEHIEELIHRALRSE